MRRLLVLVALAYVALDLIALHFDWFTSMALSATGRQPIFSDPIDLGRTGTISWIVPNANMKALGNKAQLSLVLNIHMLREVPFDRSEIQLKLRIRAEALGARIAPESRLIRDSYYVTDQPFSIAGARLWETAGRGALEYGLGAVEARPGDQLRIQVDVLVPDPELAHGNARMKLIQVHDIAGLSLEYWVLARLEGVSVLLSIGVLVAMCWWAWLGGSVHKHVLGSSK